MCHGYPEINWILSARSCDRFIFKQFFSPVGECSSNIMKTYSSFSIGFPFSPLGVKVSPFLSLKNANRQTLNPRACNISCFTVERRISNSCGFVDTELGHRLACPAIGLQRNSLAENWWLMTVRFNFAK